MAINTTATNNSKGMSKDESKKLFIALVSAKKSFNVIGGCFEESSLDRLPKTGKVEFWLKVVEEKNGIPIPIIRHLLSRLGFNPNGKTIADINKAIETAAAALVK